MGAEGSFGFFGLIFSLLFLLISIALTTSRFRGSAFRRCEWLLLVFVLRGIGVRRRLASASLTVW